jgi:glucose-6-phosphate 1-epimerase
VLGSELLYLSPSAIFAPNKAIRGGIPIVFPQFGAGGLPQHGFARTALWSLGASTVIRESGDISCTFTMEDSPTTRGVWPHHFQLVLTVVLKPTALSMQLRVRNLNGSTAGDNTGRPFSFTALLHTYLGVEDIATTTVRGLQNRQYIDQADGLKYKEDRSEALIFEGEVDRMYVAGAAAPLGFKDMVVWNPHILKCERTADLPNDAWRKFVCVEAGSVVEPVTLAAGQTWEGAQGISLQMLPDVQSILDSQIQQSNKL